MCVYASRYMRIYLRPTQINAETTAGGLALWATSLVEGDVRVNTTSWNAAYKPYASHIIESVKPNQVTEGGPILRERFALYLSHMSEAEREPATVVQIGESFRLSSW